MLGIMYYNGEGVSQNEEEAKKWFKLSADQKYPEAIEKIKILYEKEKNGNETCFSGASSVIIGENVSLNAENVTVKEKDTDESTPASDINSVKIK